MIERLFYVNESGDSAEFSVFSEFHVNVSKDAKGLSDVENEIFTESTYGRDGDIYISSVVKRRDIEITGHLKATDKPGQERLRRRLRKVLNPKERGKLVYAFGDVRRAINCYVEDAPTYGGGGPFRQFTISLLCPSPYWREETDESVPVVEWEGRMIFDATDGLQLSDDWVVGSRTSNLIVTVQNEGDVDCGIKVLFAAEGTLSNPKIYNVETLEYIQINTSMAAGDVIEVETGYGRKRATLIRDGARTNLFRYIDSGSTFLQLMVGDNLLSCTAATNPTNLTATVEFANQYLGV